MHSIYRHCVEQAVLVDPVVAGDGQSYERAALETYLKTFGSSPVNGQRLGAFVTNYALRNIIAAMQRAGAGMTFATAPCPEHGS